jgi:hypothetical protein
MNSVIISCGSSILPRLSSFSPQFFIRKAAALFALVIVAVGAQAQIAYDESVGGDFSNDGLAPTMVSLFSGTNQIFGTTGRDPVGPVDRDYFTVTIPTGFTLNSIVELPGTTAGRVSFLGLQAGNQLTLPTNTLSAAGLLGWIHYSPANIGQNLFSVLSSPAAASSGFTAPLGAGDYSFWIQDFTAGTFNYGFDLHMTPVPEASTYGVMASLLVVAAALVRHRSKGAARLVGT